MQGEDAYEMLLLDIGLVVFNLLVIVLHLFISFGEDFFY